MQLGTVRVGVELDGNYAQFVVLNEILRLLDQVDRNQEKLMSAVQDTVNALAASIDQAAERITAALADAQQPVDFSGLQAAADKISGIVPAPAPVDGVPVA